MNKKTIILIINFFCLFSLYAQLRSFNEVFPNASTELRNSALGESGFFKSANRAGGNTLTGYNSAIDPQIINTVLARNPLYLVESISVITETQENVSLLDVYNALGKIKDLKGRTYNSHTKKMETPLFEDATRIQSDKKTTPVSDPVPARSIPLTETIYIRLKDVNFGNTFYRADMAVVQNGLRYTLSNFRNITYLLIPVIREEKFIAQLYIEPISEGVLIYSIAGTDISEFIASRISVDTAIFKRLSVITSWAADGIISK
ncbi:MAG: hypothetical protein FWB86_05980 [Treponema sp.]|nr:hypothetical protein [Treponema sp.]